MNGIPPRSSIPLASGSAPQQIKTSGLGSTPVLSAIARGDYGVSKHFHSNALAALSEASENLRAAYSSQILETLSDQRVTDTMASIGTSLSALSSTHHSTVLQTLHKSTLNALGPLFADNANVFLKPRLLESINLLPISAIATDYSLFSTTTFADNINAIVSGLAAPLKTMEALESLRFSYLDSLNPEFIRAWIEDLDDDPDLAEQVSSIGTTDPFHQALLQTAARWAAVTAMSGMYLYDASIETTEKILTAVAILAFSSLVQFLIPIYGISGYVVAIVLTGAAQQVSPKKRSRLSTEGRRALELTCPYCAAVPEMWCIVARGRNFGDDARHLHHKRYLALLDD